MTASLACAIFNIVEISWLGHACFRIKGSQATVITDPYPPDLGYSLGKQSARIVTVSHPHPSHSYAEGIEGEPRVVSGPGEYEISGILITGVATFHDGERGNERGKNTVYQMEIDGISVCHLGDLGHVLNNDQVSDIGDVDVLMLPVGGLSTVDARMAAEVIRQLEPQAVIPMHYKTPALDWPLAPVSSFLEEMGIEHIDPQPKVSFTKSNLPPNTQTFLLDY